MVPSMIAFKSIIVFDSETTSLPLFDHNTTKVTELAFLGCEIEHLNQSLDIPRVLHKLVLCFNPMKKINPSASQVSGLENELLKNLPPFREEDVTILKHFISRLPSPVCIVAHSGFNFDFPILRRALEHLKQRLPNSVYCADSLDAFRFLYPKTKLGNLKGGGPGVKRKDEEFTPKSKKTTPANINNYKADLDDSIRNIITPEVCRELFADCTETPPSRGSSTECSSPAERFPQSFDEWPKSHKLKDIYSFLHKRNFPNAHRAEEDCKALLSCIIKTEKFLDWMQRNAVVFNSIEPLF